MESNTVEHDALSTVYGVLSDNWPDFEFKKSKKTWVKETDDRVLLLIQCQGSRWGAMYYLNFGAYFLDIEPINKPKSNLPKASDWHLFSRYEAFKKLSVMEQNILFSLEEVDLASLEKRCIEIALFTTNNIIPQLRVFGNMNLIRDELAKKGLQAFDPFNTQRVAKKDIMNCINDE